MSKETYRNSEEKQVPAKTLHLGLVQADLQWEDKEANMCCLEAYISSDPEIQVMVLPEMFSTGFSMNRQLAETMDGPTASWMRELSAKFKKVLIGSLLIEEAGACYNRLICVFPNGSLYHYDKRHVFAYGGEQTLITPGHKRLFVRINGWTIQLQICYDLRFPVWARQQKPRFDLLINIANWPERRSHAWKTLLAARAIENQCFVAGVNRVGMDGHQVYHSGDSALIDPLGAVLKTESHRPGLLSCRLLPETLTQTRQQFPFLEDADDFLLL